MTPPPSTQQDRALALLKQRGMVRLSEFTAAGITAATVTRMAETLAEFLMPQAEKARAPKEPASA